MLTHYSLECQLCKTFFVDDGFRQTCSTEHAPTLLTTNYRSVQFVPDESAHGIYRYRNWLPIMRDLPTIIGTGRTLTYQSPRLTRITKLPNLWIAFNGYWPERGATLETTTFKEFEAYSVLSRVPRQDSGVLVLASAGNTAAAFASACSRDKFPCLIIVPDTALERMVLAEPIYPCVKLVALCDATYYDAIGIADRIGMIDGFIPEGGVKNVARRDGLATTMLSAVETIGCLPDYYFQAIGSGAGAIAVHEVARRLLRDGRFGQILPRLMLSQNAPFAPIFAAWRARRRELIPIRKEDAERQIRRLVSSVLSNERPPYSVHGGVFDVLTDSGGTMLVADNNEAIHAQQLFKDVEGIDIDPAAAVALASLINATSRNEINSDAIVLLHITGGGRNRYAEDRSLVPIKPDLEIQKTDLNSPDLIERLLQLF